MLEVNTYWLKNSVYNTTNPIAENSWIIAERLTDCFGKEMEEFGRDPPPNLYKIQP